MGELLPRIILVIEAETKVGDGGLGILVAQVVSDVLEDHPGKKESN